MGLQRTPPHGSRAIATPSRPEMDEGQGQDAGPSGSADTSLQAFVPRNPRVMRSPQSGSTSSGSRQMGPPPPRSQQASRMEEDEGDGNVSTTPRTAPPSQVAPAPQPIASTSTSNHTNTNENLDRNPSPIPEVENDSTLEKDQGEMPPLTSTTRPAPEAFTTPLPKRRKSRHEPAPVAALPPPEDPEEEGQEEELTQFEKNAMYGKRYQAMMDTLDYAIKSSSHRMTLKEFTKCFPMFAAENREKFENAYEETRAALRSSLWIEMSATLDAEGFGPALKKIEDAVQDGKANATEFGRPDAWRPELTAKAICAAANLPVMDAAYDRLRTEYLELHSNCAQRYTSIAEKQALLKELESTVSDGVVDLEKTITAMQDFPTEDMRKWMEDVMPTLEGGRGA